MTPTSVEATTTAGRVRGFWREGSAAFLGIPFAEPPVGDLRFAAPVRHRAWDGVRDATEYGATPQRPPTREDTVIPEPSIPGDSTLNLNVFTPRPGDRAANLPVLVYIHGGGFTAGSAASPWHDGAAFNRDGIVTVSVSYRLGFDGFGWIEDAPQNRAVLDWLLALEWVRDNIAEFGGDPSQVTIAGQSAGGAAVLTLLGMPPAQHLFARVIALSAPGRGVTTLKEAEENGRVIAEAARVPPTRAGLSAIPELELFELQQQLSAPPEDPADPLAGMRQMLTGNGLRWMPVGDGDLVPGATVEAVEQGIGNTKPLMLGATDEEFNREVKEAVPTLDSLESVPTLVTLGLSPERATAYADAHPGFGTADLVGQCVTDAVFRRFNREVAEARGTAATWLYRFSWRSPKLGHASHCFDLPFFFDCLGSARIAKSFGDNPPQSLADDMHGAAVRFIRGNDPGWSAYGVARDVRAFDTPSVVLRDGYADVS